MAPSRAPFVWTPRQPIDEMGFQAVKLGRPERDDGVNRWFLFRCVVDLVAAPEQAPFDITVDGRYRLFVNERQVGRGPVRCSPTAKRYDSYELAPFLRAGRNVVAVLVHTYGVDTAFHETVKGLWRPTFGEGGLWAEGPLFSTREAWRCTQSHAWLADAPRVNHSLGFIEALDARALPIAWTSATFDDADWDVARPMLARGGGPESAYGGLMVRPFPTLVPRGVPHLEERPVRAERIVWAKSQARRPELPLTHRLYEEPLRPLAEGAVVGLENLLSGTGAAVIRTLNGCDTAFTLDFGRILTGHPAFEIEALGGETVEIACAERLPGEWEPGGLAVDARITPFRVLGNDAHLCRYVARPGLQRFERFEWCAIRYMHVVVRDAPEGVSLRSLGATASHYPVEARGQFSCSDDFLTRLWAVGAYTLRQCMHDAWEDCPSREQRQWLGDVTVENLAAAAAFGPSAAPLTAKFLIQVAESQRPDGLTQMFAPGDHRENGNLIPDWTLQWILCARDHWELTGDLETINAIWPSIQKALTWFERLRGPRGLIVDMPYWHFMDWAGVGRQGEACALNAQFAGALEAASVLAAAVGFERASRLYAGQAEQVIAALDASHWDEERGTWVDMVDPASGARNPRVSQHAVAAMALWGTVSSERLARALDRVTDPARETRTPAPPVVPFGDPLDEVEGVVMANTFYGHFVCEALARHGRVTTALDQIRRRFGPMLEAGATTLWEATSSFASLCHGFSASPTHFLSRHVLGVSPATPGFGVVRFAPNLAGLDWAQGVVAAGDRDVVVRLDGDGLGFTARIETRAPVEVTAAPGLRIVSRDHQDGVVTVRFAYLEPTS